MSDLIFSVTNGFGVITLNRESHLNALTLEMINAIFSKLKTWEHDDNVYAVIIKTTATSKAFCAGGDIRWIYKAGLEKLPMQLEFFRLEYTLNYYIANYPKPYIALMNGITMGGGVGISMHSNFAVATDKFIFAMPETTIGFFPDIGASYLLSRIPKNYGKYLGLTGKRLNAFEARNLGLLKYVISSNRYDEIFYELLNIEKSSQDMFGVIDNFFKSHNLQHTQEDLSDIQFIQESFEFTNVKEVIDFLQKNEPQDFNIFKDLQAKSPLSLCITLRQLNLAKDFNLKDCLSLDYCLVQNFIQDHDFYEGVRALLIDKDNNPKWQPDTLEHVSQDKILSYFQAPEILKL